MAGPRTIGEKGWPLGAVTEWKFILSASAKLSLEMRNVSRDSSSGAGFLDEGDRQSPQQEWKAERNQTKLILPTRPL